MLQRLLATDLDGTLFGFHKRGDASCLRKLGETLRENSVKLVFVTGRHLEVALMAIKKHSLPLPDSIVCNVGTEIFFMNRKGRWRKDSEWEKHVSRKNMPFDSRAVSRVLAGVDGAVEQENEKQARFKRSYYVGQWNAQSVIKEMNGILRRKKMGARLIYSVDPKTLSWLVDVLPQGASKKSAVEFLRRKWNMPKESIMAAGDSGNDIELLLGYNAIVVQNAMQDVKAALAQKKPRKTQERYFSRKACACGVLEGVEHFFRYVV